eukprot:TRINITY_DN11959_c0_g2_i3.p1 TRINITY_DN11959_c0_g2~~TRINITY_DN11959_c0_g2_i3.p1  ORF type:complete len:193 (-),score=22.06 TRINITY_DN11959_c0_g2_i3:182-760(-)
MFRGWLAYQSRHRHDAHALTRPEDSGGSSPHSVHKKSSRGQLGESFVQFIPDHHGPDSTDSSPLEKQSRSDKRTHSKNYAAHKFISQTVNTPTFCEDCGKFLWGLAQQGEECSTCKIMLCHECAAAGAMGCPGSPSALNTMLALDGNCTSSDDPDDVHTPRGPLSWCCSNNRSHGVSDLEPMPPADGHGSPR